MEPPSLALSGYEPLSLTTTSHTTPNIEQIGPEDKERFFREAERAYVSSSSKQDFVQLASFCVHANDIERLRGVLNKYHNDSVELCEISLYFWTIVFFNERNYKRCALSMEMFLKKYPHSPEGILLKTSLRANGIGSNVNNAENPLLYSAHLLTMGRYQESYEILASAPKNMGGLWLELIILILWKGPAEEYIKRVVEINFPRCGFLMLLNAKERLLPIEKVLEDKLERFPYDLDLRANLMNYYAKHKVLDKARHHFLMHERSVNMGCIHVFEIVKYYLHLGEESKAHEALEAHVPISEDCYEKIIGLYQRIPGCENHVSQRLLKGIEAFPKSVFLLSTLASSLEERGEIAEALEYTDRVLTVRKDHFVSLFRKARFSKNFKNAKKYIERLKAIDPKGQATLALWVLIRLEFRMELKAALDDVMFMWSNDPSDMNAKMVLDVLIQLEDYDGVIKFCNTKLNDHKVYAFRLVICHIRRQEYGQAVSKLNAYEDEVELTDQELEIKGELLVKLDCYKEAYLCFKTVDMSSSCHTIRAYLKCLKFLKKETEAKTFWDKIAPSEYGLYNEFLEWINAIPLISTAPAQPRNPRSTGGKTAGFAGSISTSKSEVKKEELVKPSDKSISLMKGYFSSAETSGVNPLYRKSQKEIVDELCIRAFIVPYSESYQVRLKAAIASLTALRGCLLKPAPLVSREIAFHIIKILTSLYSDTSEHEGQRCFSSRVLSIEFIRHALNSIRKYPLLMNGRSTRKFAEELVDLRLDRAIEKSKKSYANVEDIKGSLIAEHTKFEKLSNSEKIRQYGAAIINEIEFIQNFNFDFTDFENEWDMKILMHSVWNIRACIKAVRSCDIDLANKLVDLFPEFKKEFLELCIPQEELDGVNFEMVTFIYMNASVRMKELMKIIHL